jgi:glycosyltransferase involved in cell wall biosynthesis
MKILIVAPYFYPKIGGMENYALNISKGLKDQFGWDIVVVTSNHADNQFLKEDFAGMTIYRLSKLFKVSNTPINPFWYFQIKHIIRSEKPNAIIAHTPVPYISDIAARVGGNIPYLLTCHSGSLYQNKRYFFNFIITVYKLFLENKTYAISNRIVCVSQSIQKEFPETLRSKTVYIPNSISDKEILQQKVSIKKNNTVLFISSLEKTHSWKGLGDVLMGIKIYVEKYGTDIELLVMGDGDNKSYYETLVKRLHISDHVQFLGQKFGQDKINIIKHAKVLVVYPKTSNDAFPTVILEAWANRVPLLVSKIGVIPSIIDDRKTGYLVNPNSPENLAKDLFNLLNDRKLQHKLMTNGWKQVKNFTWNKQVVRTKELIEKVIAYG